LPVGAAIPGARAASISVERLLKERLDLLEDGGEKTRESCELNDPHCSLDSYSWHIESALLILVVMDDIDSCETCETDTSRESDYTHTHTDTHTQTLAESA
jgi:hypothetical protein